MGNTLRTSLTAGSASAAAAAIVSDLRGGDAAARPALVMVFASTGQPRGEVVGPVQCAFPDTVVLGSSTSGEFVESRDAKGSVAAVAVFGDLHVHAGLGAGLRSDPGAAVAAAVETLPRSVDDYPHATGIVLLDPMAGNGEEATLLASVALDPHGRIQLAGGAAGDDLAMQSTTVSVGSVAREDAIAIAVVHSKQPFGIGVHHGHQPLSRPLTVSKTDGANVVQIDGRPAWDVWADATRHAAKQDGVDVDAITADDIGPLLLRYEAGLKNGEHHKIRAPLARNDDGSLAFAAEIPQGAVIQVTRSTAQAQVDSARGAARKARTALGDATPAGAIVFDCICRNLILRERFAEAVRGMSEELGAVPLAGFETYGEVALSVGEMSGFHNTTTVVLAVPR